MGTIARGFKAKGGKDFTTGAIIASEMNTDLNTIYDEVNGALDENNISASANIPNSSLVKIDNAKVSHHADNDATFLGTTDPAGTDNPTLPTNLEGEIEALRYRIKANNGYFSGVQYMNTSDALATVGWTEPPIVGRNLLPNAGFEVQSGAANSAPDGWTLVGTPVIAIEASAHPEAGVDKRSIRVFAGAALDGFTRIVTGLKPDTKYLLGMAYTLTAGDVNLVTTGGVASPNAYQNIVFNDSTVAGGYEVFQGIVSTDSTPTDLTVKISASANLDDFNIYYVWLYEMSDDTPVQIPHIPMQNVEWADQNDIQTNAGAGAWVTKTDLSITQYVPHEGYRFVYEVTIPVISGAVTASATSIPSYAFRIQQKIDGAGATTVQGPFFFGAILGGSPNPNISVMPGFISMRYMIENPVSGASYEFLVSAYIEGTGANYPDTLIFNPDVGQAPLATVSSARLYTERI